MPMSPTEALPRVIRIILAEPHPAVRTTLHQMLSRDPDLETSGEVANVKVAAAVVGP